MDRLYLAPKYLGEGFINFFVNFHKILLYTLLFIFTSLPIVTIGASAAALNVVLRELAQDFSVKTKDYFLAWKQNIWKGIPYSAVIVLLFFIFSVPFVQSFSFYLLQFCGVMLLFLVAYYPIVCNQQKNIAKIFAYSAMYAFAHLLQMLMLVSLALLFLILSLYTSEFFLILFFPILYFMQNRIVIANNTEIEKRNPEEEKILNN